MEWHDDIAAARAGDAEAAARVKDYLLPFVHGVLLAHAPHHAAGEVLQTVLDAALDLLPQGLAPNKAGVATLELARRQARALADRAEQPSAHVLVQSARLRLPLLRTLPDLQRELVLLRLAEGIPGPEAAEVMGLEPSAARAALEAGATQLLRLATGSALALSGDAYLWDLGGTPHATLARLETELTVLRYDPAAAASAPDTDGATLSQAVTPTPGGSQHTAMDLPRVAPTPDDEPTNPEARPVAPTRTAPASATPARPSGARTAASPEANPFAVQPATIHAADLPAAAQGAPPQPAAPSQSAAASTSARFASLPRIGGAAGFDDETNAEVPVVAAPETRSELPLAVGGNAETRAQLPPALARSDETRAQLPPALARTSSPAQELVTTAETYVAGLPQVSDEETRAAMAPRRPPRGPRLSGTAALLLSATCVALFTVAVWFLFSRIEVEKKKAWTTVEVVVASEDLLEGTQISEEFLATRSVPDLRTGSTAVRVDQLGFIVNQHLAFPMQAGDPFTWDHFVSSRQREGLSKTVPRSERAVSIRTDLISSVGRQVVPGDIVDVLISMSDPRNATPAPDNSGKNQVGAPPPPRPGHASGQRIAGTLLKNVLVAATGKISARTPERTLLERDKLWQDVTLMLTTEEAEKMTLGAAVGQLHLTLIGSEEPLEASASSQQWTAISTLLDGKRVANLNRRRSETIKVIRSGKKR